MAGSCLQLPLMLLAPLAAQVAESKPAPVPASAPASVSAARTETLSLRGRVVWMNEALARRHGVRTVPEAAQRILALETAAGALHPLVEDIRGRAFRVDKRLRDQQVELLVRRHAGSPMIQVIRVFAVAQDQKYELDYWCEICAIAMYELKACDCCQGPIELRRRPVRSN